MNVLGLVLAGGKSRRMGADKASLKVNDESLLQRSQQLLYSSNVDTIALSFSGNHTNAHHNSTVIRDIIPHKGPLSGIHAALEQYPQHDLVVLPVDMPLLTVDSVNFLIQQAQALKHNVCFCVEEEKLPNSEAAQHTSNKVYKGLHFPIYLHNHVALREALKNVLLNTTKHSVFRFFCAYQYTSVQIKNKDELSNVNSPLQWLQILERLSES